MVDRPDWRRLVVPFEFAIAAPTTFLGRDECYRPDKHRPSGSDPRPGQGDGSPTVFSRVGDVPPAVASILLLIVGDVETNPAHQTAEIHTEITECGRKLLCCLEKGGAQRGQHPDARQRRHRVRRYPTYAPQSPRLESETGAARHFQPQLF